VAPINFMDKLFSRLLFELWVGHFTEQDVSRE
jgi:hypothetical protein